MWTSLVLFSVLSLQPAQTELSLANVTATYGLLGPKREDDTLRPGDMLFVCFDIEGITADDDGKVRYSTALEVSDASGKVLFKQQPQTSEAKLSLGGNRLPAFAHLSVGTDAKAGEFGFKVLVKDLTSGKETSVSRTVKVLSKDFALVRTAVSLDVDQQYPAVTYAVGQGIWVHCSAVGFERDAASKQPNVVFELRVADENGKSIFAKPTTNAVDKGVAEKQEGLPMAFPLSLNRPGKFTIELLAEDRVSKKKAKTSFSITVHSSSSDR